jgi:single-strand DNA-binding protein
MITTTLNGRLTSDPELRFLPSGQALAKFTVVTSKRRKVNEEWVDEGTTFWDCSAWGPEAEAVCDSLVKGCSVVVIGDVSQRTWETPEGEKRSRMEVNARTVAAVVDRRQQVRVQKVERGSQPASNGFVGNVPGPQDDPWATPAPASAASDAGFGF